MTPLDIRPAVLQDVEAVTALLNGAYRGDSSRQGWTTEADLLTGSRTTPAMIAALLQREDACLLVGCSAGEVVACIGLERMHASQPVAHLGMLAVSPQLQNRGLGKTMILAAEQLACKRWQVSLTEMAVISLRSELIAFYQRLGYQLTGESRPFPVQSELWQPQVTGLQLAILQKTLPVQATTPAAAAQPAC